MVWRASLPGPAPSTPVGRGGGPPARRVPPPSLAGGLAPTRPPLAPVSVLPPTLLAAQAARASPPPATSWVSESRPEDALWASHTAHSQLPCLAYKD